MDEPEVLVDSPGAGLTAGVEAFGAGGAGSAFDAGIAALELEAPPDPAKTSYPGDDETPRPLVVPGPDPEASAELANGFLTLLSRDETRA